jgi:hypothetical protein
MAASLRNIYSLQKHHIPPRRPTIKPISRVAPGVSKLFIYMYTLIFDIQILSQVGCLNSHVQKKRVEFNRESRYASDGRGKAGREERERE